MSKSQKVLIIVLLFPILVLAALTAYKQYIISTGQEIILPVSGYDPRDLLAGNYLIYQVDYGVEKLCSNKKISQYAFICLDDKTVSYQLPTQCKTFIRGTCDYGQFKAGIERFYIPQQAAKNLTKLIWNKKVSIVVSVIKGGHAQVKQLLINGQPF